MGKQEKKQSPWRLASIEPVGVLSTVEEARRLLLGRRVLVEERGGKGWYCEVQAVTDGGEIRLQIVKGGLLVPGPVVRVEQAARVLQLVCE